jgi:hypothetical protein
MPSDTHDVKSGDIPPVFFTEAYHPVRTTPSLEAISLWKRAACHVCSVPSTLCLGLLMVGMRCIILGLDAAT